MHNAELQNYKLDYQDNLYVKHWPIFVQLPFLSETV